VSSFDHRPRVRPSLATVAVLTAAALAPLASLPVHAQSFDPSLFSGMHWRLVGPFRAGRSVAATGVPGQPERFYFGSVDGGVWESRDAGLTWKPRFDGQPAASIGAIAVAPSDPDILYVGTGEADIRASNAAGSGMYRSDDGGKTWRHIGLDDTRRIGRILVDPRDPDRVWVAALGHAYGPNEQRGVFRTTDGGKTWQKVLYRDRNTGAIDLASSAADPDRIFAVLWGTRRPPWNVYPPSNSYGAVYETTDGGDHWSLVQGGLPGGPGVGRIGVAVSPSDPDRVYAQVDATGSAGQGGVYRSDDGGRSWKLTDDEDRIWHRGWYFGSVTVDPANADVVYVMNTSVYRSEDAGATFQGFKGAPGGDDYHQLWIDPSNARHMILASDQGVIVSVDGGGSWSSWNNQPTAQLYHVVADHGFPYKLYGSQQDSGSRWILSRAAGRGGISFRYWGNACAGGESGYIAIDRLDENILYGTSYDGSVVRCDQRTGVRTTISPEMAWPDSTFRVSWTMPIVASDADPHAIYFGNQYLFETRDRGASWKKISPDLTREAPGVPSNLDSATAHDQTAVERAGTRWGVIYSIAPSPVDSAEVWAGTDDGLVWVTRDGGTSWTDVTPGALTPWSKIAMIAASHTDPAVAWAAVDRHRLDDFAPHLFRTRDGGKSWREVDAGLPSGAWVNAVREDPERPGLLFAGTEVGVYVSFDAGDHWQSLRMNMPVSSVRDLAIRDGDLTAATHGRSMWTLDDIAPLRQMSAEVAGSTAYLFRPDTATLIRGRSFSVPESARPYIDPVELAAGENPPSGAILDYYLSSAADSVALEVVGADGEVVRRYSSTEKPHATDPKSLDIPAGWISEPEVLSASAGMHRWTWDLHYARSGSGGGRGGFFGGGGGPWVLPGRYTVRLVAGGDTLTRPLVVRQDPRSHATRDALAAQLAMARRIEAASARAAAALRQIDRVRARIDSVRSKASGRSQALAALGRVEEKIRDVQGRTAPANPDAAGVGDGGPAPGTLRYLRSFLGSLQRAVESGDSAPTAQVQTGFGKAGRSLDAALARWNALRSTDLPALDDVLGRAGLPPIEAGGA
jgi:photosystem II stability/assembly factor-like uncharacterized protein